MHNGLLYTEHQRPHRHPLPQDPWCWLSVHHTRCALGHSRLSRQLLACSPRPKADHNSDGDDGGPCGSHPVWCVYVGDKEAEPIHRIYWLWNIRNAPRSTVKSP
jgi:hypothetical protein